MQYVAQWDPDIYVKPLGGSVLQIMMLLSSQDIFTVLSFRLCHLSHAHLAILKCELKLLFLTFTPKFSFALSPPSLLLLVSIAP